MVMALMAILALGAYSALLNYYRTSIIDTELNSLVSFISRARQHAIGNATGSEYSIKFLPDKYVIFSGNTYLDGASGNDDHALEVGVVIDTTFSSDTVTFNAFTGRTGQAGSISIFAYGAVRQININSLGIVESII